MIMLKKSFNLSLVYCYKYFEQSLFVIINNDMSALFILIG